MYSFVNFISEDKNFDCYVKGRTPKTKVLKKTMTVRLSLSFVRIGQSYETLGTTDKPSIYEELTRGAKGKYIFTIENSLAEILKFILTFEDFLGWTNL